MSAEPPSARFPHCRPLVRIIALSRGSRDVELLAAFRRVGYDAFPYEEGRIAAVEIMLNTPLVSDLIFKGEIAEIKELMKRSREHGMQTFDQSLFTLYEEHAIGYDDALRNADSVNDLRLQIKLQSQRARKLDLSEGTEHMRVV